MPQLRPLNTNLGYQPPGSPAPQLGGGGAGSAGVPNIAPLERIALDYVQTKGARQSAELALDASERRQRILQDMQTPPEGYAATEGEPGFVIEDPTVAYDAAWEKYYRDTEVNYNKSLFGGKKKQPSRADRIRLAQLRDAISEYKKEDHAYLNAQATRYEQWHLERLNNQLGEKYRVDILTNMTALRDAPDEESAVAAWQAVNQRLREMNNLVPEGMREQAETVLFSEFYPTLISSYAQFLLKNGRADDYNALLQDIPAGVLEFELGGHKINLTGVLGTLSLEQREALTKAVRLGREQMVADQENAVKAAEAAANARMEEIYDRLPTGIDAGMTDEEIMQAAGAQGFDEEQLKQLGEDLPELRNTQTTQSRDLGFLHQRYGDVFDDLNVLAIYVRNDRNVDNTVAELDNRIQSGYYTNVYAETDDIDFINLAVGIQLDPRTYTRTGIIGDRPRGVYEPLLAMWRERIDTLENLEGYQPYKAATRTIRNPERYFRSRTLTSPAFRWTMANMEQALAHRARELQRDQEDEAVATQELRQIEFAFLDSLGRRGRNPNFPLIMETITKARPDLRVLGSIVERANWDSVVTPGGQRVATSYENWKTAWRQQITNPLNAQLRDAQAEGNDSMAAAIQGRINAANSARDDMEAMLDLMTSEIKDR